MGNKRSEMLMAMRHEDSRARKDKREWFCGIPGVWYLYNGDWDDPEVVYAGWVISEPAATCGFRDEFRAETGGSENELEFAGLCL